MKPVSALLTFTLAADEVKSFGAPATQVYCKSRTGDVKFRILDENKNTLTDWFGVIAGQGLNISQPGGSVEFKSTAGGTFEFQVTVGDFIDNSFIFAGGNVFITPSPSNMSESDIAANGKTTVGAGLCVKVANAVTDVRQRWVRNDNTTAGDFVFLRSDNTTAKSGVKVPPDDTVIIQSENAIYAYNPTANPIDIYVTDELTV